jgi:Flp pilus assembly protein TadD
MLGLTRLWQKAVGAVALAAVLVAAGAGLVAQRTANVQLVNGLDVPLVIKANDAQATVPSGGRTQLRMQAGKATFEARTQQGALVERLEETVPGATDVVAYNVLGAAPLYFEGVVYSKSKTGDNPFEAAAGKSFLVRDRVPYVFTDPPQTISVDKYSSGETRWTLSVAPGRWKSSVTMLAKHQQAEDAAALAARVSLLDPANHEARAYAEHFARAAKGEEGVLSYAKALIGKHPDSVEAHRAHQDALIGAGKLDGARTFYADLLSKRPGSALAGYLAARLEPAGVALPLYRKLFDAHPEDPYIARGLSTGLFAARRFDEALPVIEKMAKLDPDYGHFLPEHARTLVALGRATDAAALVAQAGAQLGEKFGFDNAVLYGKLARLAGPKAPHPADHFLDAATVKKQPELRPLFTALTGERPSAETLAQVKDEQARTAIEITASTPDDPDEALGLAADADAEALERLDRTTAVLLAAELYRTGEDDQAEAMLDALADSTVPRGAIREYLHAGVEGPDLREMDLECQAAVDLVRARALDAMGKPSKELYQSAKSEDLLQGVVTRAADHWPRPKKG